MVYIFAIFYFTPTPIFLFHLLHRFYPLFRAPLCAKNRQKLVVDSHFIALYYFAPIPIFYYS